MNLSEITPSEVKTAIVQLKNSVSQTPDNIPSFFIKNTSKYLIEPLVKLYNLSISKGEIPSLWRQAIIVPIHKRGLKNNPLNYRPISMTSVFCRLMEKVLHSKIMVHLKINNLINSSQHGFLAKRSTLSQQITILDNLTSNYDNKLHTDMIYLDFSKAFDRVSHPKLISVLENFELDSKVIEWISNYLSYRTQRTMVSGQLSNPLFISSGVPQGSVLGPLLFLLYVESLLFKITSSCKNTKVFAFADDVKLMSSDHADLQKALNIVEAWSDRWQMAIQPKKSEHITFRPQFDKDTISCNFQINQTNINKVSLVRDLGLYISSDLKWDKYIQQAKYKADKISNIILRIFKSHNIHTYTTAFKTYVRPLLEYNSIIWTPYHTSLIKQIESPQRSYTKKVCKRLNIKFDNYSERLEIMQMESLEYRRLKFDLILLYKILNKLIEVDFDTHFTFSQINNTYNLRRNSLHIQKPSISRTEIRLNFFSQKIVECWNKLPDNIVTAPSLNIFKFRLDKLDLKELHNFLF